MIFRQRDYYLDMSRPLINGLVDWDSCSTETMESLTILDPSRLKMPFGNKHAINHSRTPSITHWPVVDVLEVAEEAKCEEVMLDISSVISKQVKKDIIKPIKPEPFLQLQAWALALAYILFLLGLAFSNLFPQQTSGRICVALCPLPTISLSLQAATALSLPVGLALLLCAVLLPLTCALGTLPLTAAYITVLALAMLAYIRKRGVVAYVCSAGAVLSLGQTLLAEDQQWGVSVSVFFLGLLCVMACERTYVRVWI